MSKKRDTVTYELKDRNKVLYVGTTNDPERRAKEHEDAGKNFGHMKVTSRKMTEQGAQKKEAERIAQYQKNHGKGPKYNKTDDG